MSDKKIRVGIIGLSTERGWTAQSHLPALKAMPQFEIAAVATTPSSGSMCGLGGEP